MSNCNFDGLKNKFILETFNNGNHFHKYQMEKIIAEKY